MSTRSLSQRERKAPKTDPKWYPTTQGLNRWLNKMAERSDLTVRVLKHTSGAPARFVPTEAEIDINEGLIAGIDPIIAGSPEFVVKHRAIAGACVHEAAHARHSTRIDLPKIARDHGQRHTATFAMLEEGRCETQQWPHLTGVEKLALQSMVLEIVLRDMEDEEGNVPEMNIASVIRLTGLLSARMAVGIVDVTSATGDRLHHALTDALGADFAALYDIAVRFSQCELSWYGTGMDDMHRFVREWMAIEDRLLPPDEEGGSGGEGEGEGEGEGSGEGEGDGESDTTPGGKSKSKSKSEPKESDGGDEGDGNGKGEGGDEQSEGPTVGDDDEGTVGDGSQTLTESEADGEAALGDYASSNVDAGTFEDIFNAVREAAVEAEHVSGSRLREEVVAIHKATAASHAERRAKNKEAMRRWR